MGAKPCKASQAGTSSPGTLRRILRRLRRVVLCVLLGAAALLTYLHHVGLPTFVKDALIRQLQGRGIGLEYGHLGLRWYDGVVAQEVSLSQMRGDERVELILPEVAFRFDTRALLGLRLKVRSLEVRNGRLILPLVVTNEALQHITLDRLSAKLQFEPNDCWQLKNLSAESLGLKWRLQASITNASALREWPFLVRRDDRTAAWQSQLLQFVRQVKQMQFSQPPTISAELRGDASQPETLQAVARFGVRQAQAPWGSVNALIATLHYNESREQQGRRKLLLRFETSGILMPWLRLGRLRFMAAWDPADNDRVPRDAGLSLSLEGIESIWGSLADLQLIGDLQPRMDNSGLADLNLQLDSGAVSAQKGRSMATDLQIHLVQEMETLAVQHGDWQLNVELPHIGDTRAENLELTGHFERNHDDTTDFPLPGLAKRWQPAALWNAEAQGAVQGFHTAQVTLDEVEFDVVWTPPYLTLRQLRAQLEGRSLQTKAELDVTRRSLDAALSLDLNVRRLDPWLPEGARRWLSRYGWRPDSPPVAGAQASLILPPWEQLRDPIAQREALESMTVQGKLVAAHASFQGIPMETVTFDFNFTDRVWLLTDFIATAPEGRFGMTYREDQATRDYRFDIEAELDPHAFRSLVRQPEQQAFDFFRFESPPQARGFVSGRYRAPARTRFAGRIETGPFDFRGEPIEALSAQLAYSNGWVHATDVHLRSDGELNADGVAFEVARQRLYLTNAQTTVPPMRIARAIGDEVVKTLTPYVFNRPPQAQAEGWLNVRDTKEVELKFNLLGGPFHYWRFNLPQIQGQVLWSNQTVQLQGIEADFYGGRLTGDMGLDLTSRPGADFRFITRFEDVDFAPLAVDLLPVTNRLEGRINGIWTVTQANTEDWNSWNGYGHAELHDGYLWDLPLLGPVTALMGRTGIDAGRSSVKGMVADFTMTNSLIHTRNLELQSAAMRLDYEGTFTFQGGVDARVEARLLHDAAVVGPLVSLLFSPLTKMFEYKVSGTLGEPELELLHIPKPFHLFLDPIGTFREMFGPREYTFPDP